MDEHRGGLHRARAIIASHSRAHVPKLVAHGTCGNMRGCPRAIGYHSDTLAPFPTPESARFGLCIYQTRDIRPFARQPLKRPFRVVKSRPAPKQGLPVQSIFFAVVLNPSTQAESTGFENSQFQVPMARKPAGNCSKPHITGGADPHTAGNEDGRSKIQSKTEKPGTET